MLNCTELWSTLGSYALIRHCRKLTDLIELSNLLKVSDEQTVSLVGCMCILVGFAVEFFSC